MSIITTYKNYLKRKESLRRKNQIKSLRVRHTLDWDKKERYKLEGSWIYKLIDSLSPVSIGWLTLLSALAILIWRH